jgi:hypothetical protein
VDTAIARKETDLLEAIERTRRFSLVGDTLTFYDDVCGVARFTPGSALDPGPDAP